MVQLPGQCGDDVTSFGPEAAVQVHGLTGSLLNLLGQPPSAEEETATSTSSPDSTESSG